ncbi:unnamed protein product, partial [marine sediment metagenome]
GIDFGDSAYLPFTPVSGYIYTLSATIQAYSGLEVPDNNWVAVGFTPFNANPDSRFFNDNGDRNPIYWGLTRTASADQNDQTLTGPNAAGGEDADTISGDNIDIVLDTTQSNWVVQWYYNDILQRTVNVADAQKSNFQYVAVSTNRCDAFIDEFMLTRQLGSYAADPDPTNALAGVPLSVVLGWTPGVGADRHDVYFGTDFDDVNDANRGNPLGVLVSENQVDSTHDPCGVDLLEYVKTYYWRIDEVGSGGSPIYKGQVWSFTTELEAGIVTLYYDNFDGSSSDLDGTTPDVTPTGTEVWDAGDPINADGSFYASGWGTMFTAALPITLTTGAVYELSATLSSHTGDWVGIAFINDAPNVDTRINDNGPRLWMLVRGSDSAAADQAFIGPGTGGPLGDASTSSADEVKVRIELNSTTNWLVTWYFDGSPEFIQTVNPSTAGISINYIAFGANGLNLPASGTISSFKLVVIPQALLPNPEDGSI